MNDCLWLANRSIASTLVPRDDRNGNDFPRPMPTIPTATSVVRLFMDEIEIKVKCRSQRRRHGQCAFFHLLYGKKVNKLAAHKKSRSTAPAAINWVLSLARPYVSKPLYRRAMPFRNLHFACANPWWLFRIESIFQRNCPAMGNLWGRLSLGNSTARATTRTIRGRTL